MVCQTLTSSLKQRLMPTQCTTIDLPSSGRGNVNAHFDSGPMASDGGAVLLQAAVGTLDLTAHLATRFVDHRNPARCEHSVQHLVAQ